MKRRDDKIARAAHIKARTEGTSNEISLSVLDAAKCAADNERSRFSVAEMLARPRHRARESSDVSRETSEEPRSENTRKRSTSEGGRGKNRKGSKRKEARQARRLKQKEAAAPLHAESGVSAKRLSIEEEIARRKARRRLGRALALSVVSVVSACLVAAAVWVWHVDTTEQQGYESQLMRSLELISNADDTVLQLDEIVSDPFADDAEQLKDDVRESSEQAARYLEEADDEARAASESLRDPVEKDVANQAVISVSRRQSMMQCGMQLIKASTEMQQAAETCEAAWSKVLEADDKTHEASKLIEADDPASSKAKTQEAESVFEEAKAQLQGLRAQHSDVDLSLLIAYIDKRLEAASYAIAADDALADRNKEEAVAQNDLCNKTEADAAALASKLPANMGQLFHDAYASRWSDVIKAYGNARAEAGTSDAVIRDYLGAQGK